MEAVIDVKPVPIRPARPTDQGFICSALVFAGYNADLVDRMLDRRRCRVLIACPERDSDRILGWICFERQPSLSGAPRALIVHYVHVRPQHRREGIATQLLTAATGGHDLPVVVTTHVMPKWLEGKQRWVRMNLMDLLSL